MIRKYNMPFRMRGFAEVVRIPQYDKDYQIVFEMTDLPEGTTTLDSYTAVVEGSRSDGLVYEFDCTIAGTTVSFTVDSTMTGAAGPGEARIRFSDSETGEEYAVMNFRTEIIKSPVPDGAVDADVTAAQNAAEQCAEIVSGAEETIKAAVISQVGVTVTDPNDDGGLVIKTTGSSESS